MKRADVDGVNVLLMMMHYFLPSPIFSASSAGMISTVFSVFFFQSDVVMYFVIVLFRLPSSSHSSSISIFVLSPTVFVLDSHSFCGGALSYRQTK